PEMGEPWGEEAKIANMRLVAGKRVRLERDISDRDRYNRLLRYVYIDGVLVEGELVRLGLAKARAYPPDTRYRERLDVWEEDAKRMGRGVWQKGGNRYLPLFLEQGIQKLLVFYLPVSVPRPLQGL
ncbi:MAG: thermonuclease family protein, partial [Chloroflexota bacterium]